MKKERKTARFLLPKANYDRIVILPLPFGRGFQTFCGREVDGTGAGWYNKTKCPKEEKI